MSIQRFIVLSGCEGSITESVTNPTGVAVKYADHIAESLCKKPAEIERLRAKNGGQ